MCYKKLSAVDRAVPLAAEDHVSVFRALMQAITTTLQSDEMNLQMENWFQTRLIGFASDGANVMVGARRSVFQKLQTFVGPRKLFQLHCMAHRLELVLKDSSRSDNTELDKLESALRFIRKQQTKGGGTYKSYQAIGQNMSPAIKVRRMPKMTGIVGQQ